MGLRGSSKSSSSPKQPLIGMIKRRLSFDEGERGLPEDVPKGHFVVYVGEKKRRYIIPLSWLSNHVFQCLLQQAEEEYGFRHGMGIGIIIPCHERHFEALVATIGSINIGN